MEQLQILQQNLPFLLNAYNVNSLLSVFFLLVLVDLALKGVALWRAAVLRKVAWFVALLVVNSMGILPLIFLLMTRDEYAKIGARQA